MNVVTINGSPRKNGITASLLEEFVKGIGVTSQQVKHFTPNVMALKGCQSCMACQSSGKCIINDDMTEIYDAIEEADLLVLGTPIYFSDMTAQLKLVFDRFFPYMKEKVSANKTCVVITSQTHPDLAKYQPYVEGVKAMTGALGFASAFSYSAVDAANNRDESLNACFNLGQRLSQE